MPKPEPLKLWKAVSRTNPDDTKKVTFGRGFTAIDPYSQIRNATEQFGPAGEGWGWEVTNVTHLPTNEVGVLVRLWHGKPDTFIEQWGQAGLYIDKNEKMKDTDCMKKATTDGVTKCLSYLGFNADVFLGKFDDNKYVAKMREEFGSQPGKALDNETDAEFKKLIEDLKAAKQLDTLTTMSGRCKSMIEKIKDVDKASLNYLKSEMNAAKARLQPDEQEAA